jgi:uncharacterized protein
MGHGFQQRLRSRLAAALAASAVLSTFALPSTVMAQSADRPCCQQVQPSTLNLNVEASVKQAPDIATIQAGVVTQSRSARTAMRDNAERMSRAMAALRAAGIAERDIQTSGINLSPQYEYLPDSRPRITGYQASNMVTVKVRNLDALGPVLDALVEQGVNSINGPTFGVDNPEAALDRAREEAMTKAVQRAQLYARASGMRVRRVITINENSMSMPQPMPMLMARSAMADSAAPETPVAPGEVSLQIQLNVQFELEMAQ